MSTIIIDPCTLGLSKGPDGGVLQVKDISGLPGDIQFFIPMSIETLETFVDHGTTILKEHGARKVHVATPGDLAELQHAG